MKCLIADSSATMRRIMLNALRGHGPITAIEASDGTEALRQLGEGIELVVADWNLAGTTGLDLLRNARARQETANVPVILVTSRNRREDVEEAIRAGVSSYILRPFAISILEERVRLLIPVATETMAEVAAAKAA